MLVSYIMSSVCLLLSQFSQLYYLSCNIWGCVYSAYPIMLWWLWEYVYFYLIIIRSSRKYEPFAIIYGQVMKQWDALYVF